MSSCRLCNSLERKKSQQESKHHVLIVSYSAVVVAYMFSVSCSLLTSWLSFNFVDVYGSCPILRLVHRYIFLARHASWVWNMNPSFQLEGRLVASTVKNVLPAWWKNSIILNFALRLFCCMDFRIWLK